MPQPFPTSVICVPDFCHLQRPARPAQSTSTARCAAATAHHQLTITAVQPPLSWPNQHLAEQQPPGQRTSMAAMRCRSALSSSDSSW